MGRGIDRFLTGTRYKIHIQSEVRKLLYSVYNYFPNNKALQKRLIFICTYRKYNDETYETDEIVCEILVPLYAKTISPFTTIP